MDGQKVVYIVLLLGMGYLLAALDQPKEITVVNGQTVVAGLFDIHKGANGFCGPISVSEIQSLEAVRWVFEQLNKDNYLPGGIGLEAYDTCGSSYVASDILQYASSRCLTNGTAKLAGLIGPSSNPEAVATSSFINSRTKDERLLQIIYSATAAELSDSAAYPNLLRVIPSDKYLVEVIVKTLLALGRNYLAIIYTDDPYNTKAATYLRKELLSRHMCVPVFRHVSQDKNNTSYYNIYEDMATDRFSDPINLVVFFGIVDRAQEFSKLLNSEPFRPTMIYSDMDYMRPENWFDPNNNIFSITKGSLAVTPSNFYVDEFAAYWDTIFQSLSSLTEAAIKNPWLIDAYKSETGCTPQDVNFCGQANMLRHQSIYAYYAIKSAYTMAYTLKAEFNDTCATSPTICVDYMKTKNGNFIDKARQAKMHFSDEFPSLPKILSEITVQFDKENDDIMGTVPTIEIFNLKMCDVFCYEKVGQLNDFKFTMNTSNIVAYVGDTPVPADQPVKQCYLNHGCSECMASNLADSVYVIPGDFYVVAAIPVYGTGTSPSACGKMQFSSSIQLAEAIAYATEQINLKTGQFQRIFPGIKIGAVIFNSCYTALQMEEQLLHLFTRCDTIGFQNISCESIRKNVLGLVGGLGSSVSIRMSVLLKDLNIVQVAYGSTSTEFSKRNTYSNFMRTCDPDDKQAKAMLEIMKLNNWKYASLVYVDDAYGRTGKEALLKLAPDYDVCFTEPILAKVSPKTNYHAIFDQLKQESNAKVVVMFLSAEVAERIMTASRNKITPGQYIFIGSETWGNRLDVIQNAVDVDGSITLSPALPANKGFDSYLRNRKVLARYENNPWIERYWEQFDSCHFKGSFNQVSQKLCDDKSGFTDIATYKQDLWAPYAIDAVYSLVLGAHKHFVKECGNSAKEICDHYRRKMDDLWGNVKSIELDNGVEKRKVFDALGNGTGGYKVHNIQKDPNDHKLIYKDVGHWDGVLHFDQKQFLLPDGARTFTSECDGCEQCIFSADQNTNTIETFQLSGAEIGLLLAVCIIVGILSAVGTWLFFRRRTESLYATISRDLKPLAEVPAVPTITGMPRRSSDERTINIHMGSGNSDSSRDCPDLPPPDDRRNCLARHPGNRYVNNANAKPMHMEMERIDPIGYANPVAYERSTLTKEPIQVTEPDEEVGYLHVTHVQLDDIPLDDAE